MTNILIHRKEDVSKERIQNVFTEIRKRATKNSNVLAKVVSVNNFPTAAGLASSASGYACLVYTLAQAYGVEGDLSVIARVGSGSACRSMFGGFVKWEMGTRDDGLDSRAVQVQPETHWEDMRVLVCVVSNKQKETSSTSGMMESGKTSKLLRERVHIVPKRMIIMEKAIKERDFTTFGNLMMLDSNDFHAVCADTTPQIFYLNEVSKRIIKLVNDYNEACKEVRVAFTFDAGPNACLFVLKQHLPELEELIKFYFPTKDGVESKLSKDLQGLGDRMIGGLQDILLTSGGPGPQIVNDHLVDEKGNIKK
jgi:diphosphomevalonate decarboxylase